MAKHYEDDPAARVVYLETELKFIAGRVACGVASKIEAIKAWRSATGDGLKDSKDQIERIAGVNPEPDRLDRLEKRVEALERFRSGMPA